MLSHVNKQQGIILNLYLKKWKIINDIYIGLPPMTPDMQLEDHLDAEIQAKIANLPPRSGDFSWVDLGGVSPIKNQAGVQRYENSCSILYNFLEYSIVYNPTVFFYQSEFKELS